MSISPSFQRGWPAVGENLGEKDGQFKHLAAKIYFAIARINQICIGNYPIGICGWEHCRRG
jgi:hypothetical protein